MKIKIIYLNDLPYIAPINFKFFNVPINSYPSFCGAGHGIGDKVVPEKIGELRCSHI